MFKETHTLLNRVNGMNDLMRMDEGPRRMNEVCGYISWGDSLLKPSRGNNRMRLHQDREACRKRMNG
jgi:hypothetical protein